MEKGKTAWTFYPDDTKKIKLGEGSTVDVKGLDKMFTVEGQMVGKLKKTGNDATVVEVRAHILTKK